MSKRIDNIIEDIKDQYLERDNNIPWIIGFSGGNDSTVVLTLVWKALLAVRECCKQRYPGRESYNLGLHN